MRNLLKTVMLIVCLSVGGSSISTDDQRRQDRGLKDLFTASSPRRYGSYNKGYDAPEFIPGPVPVPVAVPSYGPSSVILPPVKPAKETKGWTKNIFKSKGNSALPSYALPPPFNPPIYTPNVPVYSNEGYGYHYASGYSYGENFGYSRPPVAPPVLPQIPYPSSYNGYGTYNLPVYPVRPPLLGGSSLLYDGYYGYPSVPTLFGAFDHYRGPIYYGGFRPTAGPFGGPLYSELLSVTDSYGRPIFPGSLLYGRKSTDVADVSPASNNAFQSAASTVAALTAAITTSTETPRP